MKKKSVIYKLLITFSSITTAVLILVGVFLSVLINKEYANEKYNLISNYIEIIEKATENLINNTPGFKDKYIEFLSSGGRDYPLEVLKIIDIDLCDTKVFESAMEYFKSTLDKFKELYNEK